MSRPLGSFRSICCAVFSTGSLTFLTGGCAQPAAEQEAPPPPRVSTIVASEGTLRPQASLPGLIAPYRNVAIQSSLVSGGDPASAAQSCSRCCERFRARQV